MNESQATPQTTDVTFARLPVFDAQKNLWGYELKDLSCIQPTLPGSDSKMDVTAELMGDAALAVDKIMDRDKKIIIGLSCEHILQKIPYALPPGRTVIKLTDTAAISNPVIQALVQLRKDQYQILVPWVKKRDTLKALYELADFVWIKISQMVLPDMVETVQNATSYKTEILADRVNNLPLFDICEKAGFTLFTGSFFKQPENISVKNVLAGSVSRISLLKTIEQDQPDFDQLAEAIQADVTVSFRLLAYLNSASFGFRRKIDSIKDAITLLGWHQLRNWLRVILLSEVSDSRHAAELVYLSAQRGKFLEQVGIDHDYWGFEPDSLSLLGTFSLLDALLNQPMADILKVLPLADKLKGALCLEDNNEYVPLLILARYVEEAATDKSEAMIGQLGLDTLKVRQAYHQSIDWANQLCGITRQ